jgi:hypothetical protein
MKKLLTLAVLSCILTGCSVTRTQIAYNFATKKIEIGIDLDETQHYNRGMTQTNTKQNRR